VDILKTLRGGQVADEPFGPVSGLIAGEQAGQQQQMGQMKLAEQGFKLQSDAVALESARMMLEKQKQFAKYMGQLNQGGQGASGVAAGGDNAAKDLAHRLFAMSDAALHAQLPEEAGNIMEHGEKLLKGQMELEKLALERQFSTASLISNLVKDIKPGDTEEFHKRILIGQGIAGQAVDPKLLQTEFTEDTKKRLLAAAETTKDQAERKLRETDTTRAEAETDLARRRLGLVDAQTRSASARAAAIKKVGGLTKKDQETVNLRQDVIHDVDDLINQIQENPDVTGMHGRFSELAETAKTITGAGSQETPAHQFSTTMDALLLKLPKALTGTARSAADERALVHGIADLRRLGTTDKIALDKLDKIKSLLQSQIDKSPIKPTEKQSLNDDMPTISTDAEFDALESGTEFVDSDGKHWKKP
jgi:hypothetical protein